MPKKKVKDLTIGEVFKICENRDCNEKCPLWKISAFDCALISEKLKSQLDEELEIEEGE